MRRALLFFSLALLAACQAPIAPGAVCTRSADCTAPLVCRFGRCRAECAADRDCPTATHCVFGTESTGSCTLDEEHACTSASCPSGLVCTSDGCRDVCSDLCRGGNVCIGGACVPSDVDAGTTVAATACARSSDCVAPRVCVETDLLRLCELPCATAADCQGDVDCYAQPLAEGGNDTMVCGVDCDPITHDGCIAGAFCAFDTFTNGYASFCRGTQAGAMGEGCACADGDESTDCLDGLVCARERADLVGRCVRVCRGGETCPGGDPCFLPPRPFTRGGIAFGYCSVGAAAACP